MILKLTLLLPVNGNYPDAAAASLKAMKSESDDEKRVKILVFKLTNFSGH